MPGNTYMVECNIKLRERTAAEISMFATPGNTITLNQSQIASGYTFDFSANNLPAISGAKVGDLPLSHFIDIGAIPSSNEYAGLREILNSSNGFKDYAYYLDKTDVYFNFATGSLSAGTYRVTMNIYLAEGGELNGWAVHSPGANSPEIGLGYFNATRVPGTDRLYTLTADIVLDANSTTLQTYYGGDTEICYISSISIQKIG